MANPNLFAVTSGYGVTSYLIPTNTSATTWTALTPATGTVNKIENMVASNVTGSAAAITVSINSATGGFYVSGMTIGTSTSPVGISNISVAYNQIVNISASNILVSFA